jgi:SAM-dependent methyltransferase
MTDDRIFDEVNDAKVDMGHLYDQADPRAYCRELKKIGYKIPSVAKPIFERLIACMRRYRHGTVCLLDLGCSYGVNAALLKHDLSIADLYHHWGQRELASTTPQELMAYDKRFFGSLDENRDIKVIGLDVADNAVAFAEKAGLLDDGLAINLENEALTDRARARLETVDLVMSTGCVGYVTEKSFDKLLATFRGRKPWIANFVLRVFPFDPIEETLKRYGYVTEKLEGETFVQRECGTAEEHRQMLDKLRQRRIGPMEKEVGGHLLAEFYLSRPKADALMDPIRRLLPTGEMQDA